MNYTPFYLEANIACIIILTIILINEAIIHDEADYRLIFHKVLGVDILYMLLDSIWSLIDGNILPKTPSSLSLINYLIIFATYGMGYYWLLYSFAFTRSTVLQSPKRRRNLARILHFFILILILLMITGHPVYVDEQGLLHHAWIYHIALIPPYLCTVIGALQCFNRARDKRSVVDRLQCIIMTMYPIVLVLFSFLQIVFLHLPIICYSITIVIIFIYLVFLQNMILSDPLTQLNNRNQLNRFISTIDHDTSREQKADLCLMMIDADRFKSINDTYGHANGDEALKIIADSLKKTCGVVKDVRPFLARYGGDEFIAAIRTKDEDVPEVFSSTIQRILKEECGRKNLPYQLQVSIGWAFLEPQESCMDCIERADRAMYQKKANIMACNRKV